MQPAGPDPHPMVKLFSFTKNGSKWLAPTDCVGLRHAHNFVLPPLWRHDPVPGGPSQTARAKKSAFLQEETIARLFYIYGNMPSEELINMMKRIDRQGPNAKETSASMAAVIDVAPEIESAGTPPPARRTRIVSSGAAKRFAAVPQDEHVTNRQAELFYLQKQIQLQTQMIFVMEDGARIQGVVEWYDRQSIKVRGKSRVLIYKSAIKYLYKAGEMGSAPGE